MIISRLKIFIASALLICFSNQLVGSNNIFDTQYIKIQFDETFEFKLGTNFCNIYPKKTKIQNQVVYFGDCINTMSVTAPYPVIIQVSLSNHTLTSKDKLKVYMNPPKTGLARNVTLWDGRNPAFEEQLVRGIQGTDLDYRIKFEYIGDEDTTKTEKDALISFTLVASETV